MSTWDFAGAVGDPRSLKGTEHQPVTSRMISTRTHSFSPATEFFSHYFCSQNFKSQNPNLLQLE